MAGRTFRPAWWAVLVVIALSALMIALGVWQLRRGWAKEALIERYQQASADSALPIGRDRVAKAGEIERGDAVGRFDGTRQLLFDNQSHDGRPGYHVWTPLLQNDGSIVMVDRGWIAHDAARALTGLDIDATPREVRGFWRALPQPGMRLKTDNCPAQPWPRTVAYPTLNDLRCLYGPAVAPGVLLMAAEAPQGYVRDWQTAPELDPAKHYGYAGQWFAFTLTLLVIFIKLSFRDPSPRS